MKPEPLTAHELEELAERLPGWQVTASALERTFVFKSYLGGVDFVRRLAVVAEELDHHPDLFVGWRKVTVKLSTHSAGAVTRLDEALALKAETMA